jgi:hypothetical protein
MHIRLLKSEKLLPTMGQIQEILKPGESFLKVSLFDDYVVKYCITRTDYISNSNQMEMPDIVAASKVVNAAVTRVAPADVDADRQYPVQAAVKLWGMISSGMERCLDKSNHLILSLPRVLGGTPVAALLRKQPAELSSGWDLKDADWVGTTWSLSFVGSAAELLAARRIASASGGELSYLGIGDPELEAIGASFAPSPTALSSPVPLSELGNLPQTRAEIEAFRGAFGNKSTCRVTTSISTRQ